MNNDPVKSNESQEKSPPTSPPTSPLTSPKKKNAFLQILEQLSPKKNVPQRSVSLETLSLKASPKLHCILKAAAEGREQKQKLEEAVNIAKATPSNLKETDEFGRNALHFAAFYSQLSFIETVFATHERPFVQLLLNAESEGKTVLGYLLWKMSSEENKEKFSQYENLIERLIKLGARVKLPTSGEKLFEALEDKDRRFTIELVDKLFTTQAEEIIEFLRGAIETPPELPRYVISKQYEKIYSVVKKFLDENKKKIFYVDTKSKTIIDRILQLNYPAAIDAVDFALTNKDKKNLFHFLAEKGKVQEFGIFVYRLCLKNDSKNVSAILNAIDNQGKTPLEYLLGYFIRNVKLIPAKDFQTLMEELQRLVTLLTQKSAKVNLSNFSIVFDSLAHSNDYLKKIKEKNQNLSEVIAVFTKAIQEVEKNLEALRVKKNNLIQLKLEFDKNKTSLEKTETSLQKVNQDIEEQIKIKSEVIKAKEASNNMIQTVNKNEKQRRRQNQSSASKRITKTMEDEDRFYPFEIEVKKEITSEEDSAEKQVRIAVETKLRELNAIITDKAIELNKIEAQLKSSVNFKQSLENEKEYLNSTIATLDKAILNIEQDNSGVEQLTQQIAELEKKLKSRRLTHQNLKATEDELRNQELEFVLNKIKELNSFAQLGEDRELQVSSVVASVSQIPFLVSPIASSVKEILNLIFYRQYEDFLNNRKHLTGLVLKFFDEFHETMVKKNISPLYRAAEFGDIELFKQIKKQDSSLSLMEILSQKNYRNRNFLHAMIINQHYTSVDEFLDLLDLLQVSEDAKLLILNTKEKLENKEGNTPLELLLITFPEASSERLKEYEFVVLKMLKNGAKANVDIIKKDNNFLIKLLITIARNMQELLKIASELENQIHETYIAIVDSFIDAHKNVYAEGREALLLDLIKCVETKFRAENDNVLNSIQIAASLPDLLCSPGEVGFLETSITKQQIRAFHKEIAGSVYAPLLKLLHWVERQKSNTFEPLKKEFLPEDNNESIDTNYHYSA